MDKGGLHGKVVLITGAASGFGADAACRFAKEGARLALCDLNGEALAAVCASLIEDGTHVEFALVDVSDPDQVAQFHENIVSVFGRIDIAINNAGVAHDLTPLPELSIDEFDRVFSVNARGVFLGLKAQIPIMVAQKGGVILNIASAAGLVGAGQLSAYAASKHAVVGLTRSAADECARHGIRINALCPSFAQTPLFDDMAEHFSTRQDIDAGQVERKITQRSPMGRLATSQEVVDAMVWLCSPQNSFMTGQAIALDGGLTAI